MLQALVIFLFLFSTETKKFLIQTEGGEVQLLAFVSWDLSELEEPGEDYGARPGLADYQYERENTRTRGERLTLQIF